MKTREMLALLTANKYPMNMIAEQAGVGYFRLYRYIKGTAAMSPDEKAKLWRFAIMQPLISEALAIEIEEDGK